MEGQLSNTITQAAAYAALAIIKESPDGYRSFEADQCLPYVRQYLPASALLHHEDLAALQTVDLLNGDLSALEPLASDIGAYIVTMPGQSLSQNRWASSMPRARKMARERHMQRRAA